LDRDLADLAAEPSCITPPIDAANARRPASSGSCRSVEKYCAHRSNRSSAARWS